MSHFKINGFVILSAKKKGFGVTHLTYLKIAENYDINDEDIPEEYKHIIKQAEFEISLL